MPGPESQSTRSKSTFHCLGLTHRGHSWRNGDFLPGLLSSVLIKARPAGATSYTTQRVCAEETHLGRGLPDICGPRSCRGPLHKEKTRVQSLGSHDRESCAGPAGSASGPNSCPSSCPGPSDGDAGKQRWSSSRSSCLGGRGPVQPLPTAAGRS